MQQAGVFGGLDDHATHPSRVTPYITESQQKSTCCEASEIREIRRAGVGLCSRRAWVAVLVKSLLCVGRFSSLAGESFGAGPCDSPIVTSGAGRGRDLAYGSKVRKSKSGVTRVTTGRKCLIPNLGSCGLSVQAVTNRLFKILDGGYRGQKPKLTMVICSCCRTSTQSTSKL